MARASLPRIFDVPAAAPKTPISGVALKPRSADLLVAIATRAACS
jgi:hypothetical protein